MKGKKYQYGLNIFELMVPFVILGLGALVAKVVFLLTDNMTLSVISYFIPISLLIFYNLRLK